MAGFVIANVHITDPERYKKYIELAPATVAQYGGEYLVRGGETAVAEGEWSSGRTVVLRFESVAKARAWYDSEEYRDVKAIRHAAANSNMIFVEGV